MPLPHDPPIFWKIRNEAARRGGYGFGGVIGADWLDGRIVKARLRKLGQKWA